jgi:tryptophan synthase alpha chain
VSKMDEVFARQKAVIGYLTVGYPDPDTTIRAARVLAEHGCAAIELGIPFSDPIGDGPTIQQASFFSLSNGTDMRTCLKTAEKISRNITVPLIYMSYYNPILAYGPGRFCRDASGAGVCGLIVPDLPPEEAGELAGECAKNHLDLIFLLSPASPISRVELVAEKGTGFIYLTSVAGVTGIRTETPGYLPEFIQRVKRAARQPVCVGFGLSSPEQVREVLRLADGAIIGSKIIQLIEEDHSLHKLEVFIDSVASQSKFIS